MILLQMTQANNGRQVQTRYVIFIDHSAYSVDAYAHAINCFSYQDGGDVDISGSPTEKAILAWAVNVVALPKGYPLFAVIYGEVFLRLFLLWCSWG